MKVRKNHTRFLCGSLAAAAAISPHIKYDCMGR